MEGKSQLLLSMCYPQQGRAWGLREGEQTIHDPRGSPAVHQTVAESSKVKTMLDTSDLFVLVLIRFHFQIPTPVEGCPQKDIPIDRRRGEPFIFSPPLVIDFSN